MPTMLECAQRIPNYQSSFCRRPQDGVSSLIPGVPSSEGVPNSNLCGGMETPHLHAPVKELMQKLFAVANARDQRFGGRCSWHLTACLTDLHCSSSAGRPSHRGRPSRPHGPARRSGAHPRLHPRELEHGPLLASRSWVRLAVTSQDERPPNLDVLFLTTGEAL